MAAYRRVYDSRHLQADCQEPPGSAGSYTLGSRVRASFTLSTRPVLFLRKPAWRDTAVKCAGRRSSEILE